MPLKIQVAATSTTKKKKKLDLKDRPDFVDPNSSAVKRTDEEYKIELAKRRAARSPVPRFSSPNRQNSSKSPSKVKSKNLGASGVIKVFDKEEEKAIDEPSIEFCPPPG